MILVLDGHLDEQLTMKSAGVSIKGDAARLQMNLHQ